MKIQIIKEKHVLYDSLQSNRTHEQTCMISHLIAYLQGDVYVLITDKCFVAVNVKNFSTKSHNYYMVALESLLGMIDQSQPTVKHVASSTPMHCQAGTSRLFKEQFMQPIMSDISAAESGNAASDTYVKTD